MKKALGKFALELLDLIRKSGELYDRIVSRQVSIGRMTWPTYYRSLRDLKREELVQKIERNKRKKKHREKYRVAYVLSDKGKKLLKARTNQQRRPDGFSTVVMFDIPEEKAKQRTIFRRYLLRNGYILLQESVMLSPLPLSREAKDLMLELAIRNFVTVLSAKVHHNI